MKDCVEIIADGQLIAVDRNITLLQALRDNGVNIPSLCFYPSLGGYGSCGLCVVEVYSSGNWLLRHSCLLYPEEGMQVRTATLLVQKQRAQAARLLLRRGPFHKKEVEEMLIALVQEGADVGDLLQKCDSAGAAGEGRAVPLIAGCILCGLCVRICRKVGKGLLTFLGRGENLRIGMVLGQKDDPCGNCRACRRICPTGFITPNARCTFTASLY